MNRLRKRLLVMAVTLSPGLMSPAQAVEVVNDQLELQFQGNIVAAPCTVDLPGGAEGEVVVDFGIVDPNDLLSPNSSGNWQAFSIRLKDCGTTTTKYHASFAGPEAGTDSTKYQNAGTATRLEIELQSDDGSSTVLNNGQQYTGNIVNTAAELKMKARPYSVQGGVTSGSIEGLVQVAFTYE